jgi:hypothetical protein
MSATKGPARKRLTVADYERMAEDYAAHPVRDTEVVGPVELGMTDFTITQVWDLPSREPLLVTGLLVSGDINQGAVLRNTTTGAEITVLGLEFHAHRGKEYTLIIDRRDAENVQIGHRLVST